jgi:2,4-dienoyl-CoA reductase-like NADH-dependent reductase (Old Yellow Enzyme family)
MPNDLMALYYQQRASEGGLIIGEATKHFQTGNRMVWQPWHVFG